MPVLSALVASTATLTSSGVFTNGHTAVIGGKTYTFETSLTNVDGHVLIGADRTASHANLKAAVNLEAGAGTTYAAATTANTQVKATSATATTTVFAAKFKGALGNQISTTETLTNVAWGGTEMTGGSGDFIAALANIPTYCQCNAEVETAFTNLLNS